MKATEYKRFDFNPPFPPVGGLIPRGLLRQLADTGLAPELIPFIGTTGRW
jgi:hypothetical protein